MTTPDPEKHRGPPRERRRRPEPERRAPIRGGWLDLFGPPSRPPAEPPGGSAGGGPSDTIARAVELGYRVVDDYVRQGQAAAQRSRDPAAAAGGLGGDVQDMMTRWFQYTSELSELWFRMIGLAAAGAAPGAAAPGTPPVGAPGAAAEPGPAPARSRVAVAVSCARPVEVILDLRPEACGERLRAHDLRSADADRPRIEGVVVERGADGVTLRIRVPDTHPDGTYSGLLLDEASSVPVGSVSVRVGRGG